MRFSVLYSTAKDMKEAKKIADALIKEKLAACISIFPIESMCRWKGKLCNEKEAGMIIKTTQKKADEAIERIKEIHSYEIPCIISLNIDKGNEEFLEWIAGEVKS